MNQWRRPALVALVVLALMGAGCSAGSGGAFSLGGDPPAPTGTLEVHLTDPTHHYTPDHLKQNLLFAGTDSQGFISYGPVELPFAEIQVLGSVPVQTVKLLATDPDDPTVLAEAPAVVQPGEVSYVTDMVLRPVRQAGAQATPLPKGSASALAGPRPVGAGFIQTSPSSVGAKGANAVMAGAHAFSATSSLEFPYRTNSWLTPILVADNYEKAFLGQDSYLQNAPRTIYQKPVYPRPWTLAFNVQPQIGQTGLVFSQERVRTGVSTLIPTPDNKGVTGAGYLDVMGTYDVATLKVDPGFEPYTLKVHRQGDYDAELLMRAIDDDDFEKKGLPKDAALKLGVVRGSPLLHFRAYKLPSVRIQQFYAGPNTNTPGTLTVGGVQVGYNVVTAPYPNNQTLTTVLFWPAASASYTPAQGIDSTLVFASAEVNNYFVIASLPGPSFADQATLQKLAEAAFNYPVGSTVTYSHDQASQTTTATYSLQTTNVLGLQVDRVLQGLMPHHYLPSVVHQGDPVLQGNPPVLQNGGGQAMEFLTVRGRLRVYDTATFSCAYPFTGVLPWMPPLKADDSAGRAQLQKWIYDAFVAQRGGEDPPYTAMKAGVGQDTYNVAKFLGRNVLAAASILNTQGDQQLGELILANTRTAIETYFRENPTLIQQTNQGQAPYYLYYDPLVGTLNMYPSTAAASGTAGGKGGNTNFPADTNDAPYDGFGTLSRCNDHHFHYGYFIYAASEIALRDPAWGAQWKDAINQLVFDVANDPAVNPAPVFKFPKYRNWDPWMNHGMAAGFNWDVDNGNNEESVSEHINFWIGVMQWAAATDQAAMLEQAQAHYAAAVHSSWVYWYDPTDRYGELLAQVAPGQPSNWPGKGAVRIFDALTLWSNFFFNHPAAQRGITLFPLTPGHFYHAMNPDVVTQVMADYDAFVATHDLDPLHPAGLDSPWYDNPPPPQGDGKSNQWLGTMNFYSCFAKYVAFADPDHALERYYPVEANYDVIHNVVPWDKVTDPGDSGVAVYHLVRFLQTHGRPDTWTRATNTPFFMVFHDQGTGSRTYVGFNSTQAPLTIEFDDGQSIPTVAARSMGVKTVTP